jgi:hypothetical protein
MEKKLSPYAPPALDEPAPKRAAYKWRSASRWLLLAAFVTLVVAVFLQGSANHPRAAPGFVVVVGAALLCALGALLCAAVDLFLAVSGRVSGGLSSLVVVIVSFMMASAAFAAVSVSLPR